MNNVADSKQMVTPADEGENRWQLAGRSFSSRLLLGSSGYPNQTILHNALAAAQAEIVTVAVRRVDMGDRGEFDTISQIARSCELLPNTAGCFTASDAVLTASLAREALGCDWVKLEVIGDAQTLYPDPVELLDAAQQLVSMGFRVLPYCSDDPVLCRRLEDIGCAAIMPLASPIGSGNGLLNPYNLEIIRRQTELPMIIDAGLGTASDVVKAMELGADGVLLNTAVARSRDPVRMAHSMRLAVRAGRLAWGAGRIPKLAHGEASSPLAGLIGG